MKRFRVSFCLLALACCAHAPAENAAPARSPMDWSSVHTNAIAAWRTAHRAPEAVVADAAARTVTFLAEATGVRGGETVEFCVIGPLSDRAYEALFVSVATPAALAAACAQIGLPCGVPPDRAAARLWPQGEKVSVRVKRAGASGAPGALAQALLDTRAADEGDLLARPFVWTGGARAHGVPVAHTNVPCAVFALYNHAPSLLQLDDTADQSSVYGRFRARDTLPLGELWEITVGWDGARRTLERTVRLTAEGGAAALTALKAEAAQHDVYARLAFADDVPLARAAGLAQAFAALDGHGLKMNGAAPGQFFYRAFLPDPAWRTREGRLFQPFEVHLGADGAKRFVYCEEDWSGPGTDPVLKPRATPFADWREVPALIAATGEPGEKIDVLLVFAPGATPVSQLTPALALAPRISTFYLFAADRKGQE